MNSKKTNSQNGGGRTSKTSRLTRSGYCFGEATPNNNNLNVFLSYKSFCSTCLNKMYIKLYIFCTQKCVYFTLKTWRYIDKFKCTQKYVHFIFRYVKMYTKCLHLIEQSIKNGVSLYNFKI